MHNPQASVLRRLLAGPEFLTLPGVYDALTARIAANVGFKCLVMGGYSIAASRLGQPDVGYLTMTEMSQALKNICDAVDLPVMADGDTGYGNALSVRRTVIEYEKAGAAAILFEDQIWPKRCGHMQGKEVIPAEEHAVKIRAAVDARTNPDTVIIARTDSRAVYDLKEAIRRGWTYFDAGADALFIEAPQDEAELKAIGHSFPGKILLANMVEGGKTPLMTSAQLQELGFRIVFWPCTALYTVFKALEDVFSELKNSGTTAGATEKMNSFQQFNALVGLPEYTALEKRYCKKE
ncbi:MAG: oxaloacetate decarboxylase [Negativicutes bacterium]